MRELVWRPRAQLDRESIALYLGIEQGSPQAALSAIRRIDKAIEHILALPDAGGRFRHDGLEHEYRTAHAKPYTIYYRFDDSLVAIYRIIHQRQDIDAYALVGLE